MSLQQVKTALTNADTTAATLLPKETREVQSAHLRALLEKRCHKIPKLSHLTRAEEDELRVRLVREIIAAAQRLLEDDELAADFAAYKLQKILFEVHEQLPALPSQNTTDKVCGVCHETLPNFVWDHGNGVKVCDFDQVAARFAGCRCGICTGG